MTDTIPSEMGRPPGQASLSPGKGSLIHGSHAPGSLAPGSLAPVWASLGLALGLALLLSA